MNLAPNRQHWLKIPLYKCTNKSNYFTFCSEQSYTHNFTCKLHINKSNYFTFCSEQSYTHNFTCKQHVTQCFNIPAIILTLNTILYLNVRHQVILQWIRPHVIFYDLVMKQSKCIIMEINENSDTQLLHDSHTASPVTIHTVHTDLDKWTPQLPNTAHNCTQLVPVTSWFTLEWPGNSTPLP